jgi:hypothetical protein
MFPIEWLRQFISWCSLPILVLLGLIFIRRRQYREFPLFFSYVFVTVLADSIRLIVYIVTRPPSLLPGYPFAYTYTYWISSLVGSVFAIMAVYEIFIKRLFADFYKIRFYRFLFPAVALTIVLLAILTAVLSPDQPWKLIGAADRVLVFIRVVFLGFFTLLMILMGREWTRYELGVAFGFGIFTAASFFTSAMWVQERNKDSLVSYLPTIAWDITCLIWLIAFGKVEKTMEEIPGEPLHNEVLDEAKKWEGTLKGWLAPPKKRR